MAAHAHYPEHSAPRSQSRTAPVKFLLWLVILAALVWLVGTLVAGELGTVVTDWFDTL